MDTKNLGLERVGAVMSVLTAVLLAVSVFFDWNFLRAVGLRFSEIPTGIQDHLRSAIVWAPGLVITVTVGSLVRFVRFPRMDHRTDFVILYTGMVAGVAMVLLGPFREGLDAERYIAAGGVWILAAMLVVVVRRREITLMNHIGILGPALVMVVGYAGYAQGERMLRAHEVRWTLTLRNGQTTERLEVGGMRRFDRASVLIDLSRHVRVVPSEDIVKAELTKPQQPDASWCEAVSLWCTTK